LKSTDEDLPLKLRTSQLFRQLGFLPEIAAQITARSYQEKYAREQLSDYDVLGIKFEPDLQIRRIAAECKSGDRKALEELLKLKGIVAAFGIERGYFIKRKYTGTRARWPRGSRSLPLTSWSWRGFSLAPSG